MSLLLVRKLADGEVRLLLAGTRPASRLHPGCAPLRYGGKGSPPCFAPGKVPVSSPRPRKSLDRLLEGVARAEGGNLLGRDLHLLPGLGVSALPGLALLDGELTEARDLDLLAGLERLGHHPLEGRKVPLGFTGGHVGLLGNPLDQLLLLHYCSFLRLTWADWRHACVAHLPVLREPGPLAIAAFPTGLAKRMLLGCATGDTLHLVQV